MAEKNSDGSWSDYIFANGQRIARADSYDERIHTHGTSSGTGEYASWHLPLSGYVVKSGDKISWRQYQAGGGRGGVLIGFTDSSTANWDTYDQNGEIINSASTQDQWMQRTVDLSAFAGKTMRTVGVVTDAQTGACTWDIYYSDMAITGTDGTVTPIYDRESAVSLQYYSSAGITNAVAQAERSNTADDAIQPGNTTTYYVGDQIGSERMQLAAGGWPLSSATYYPYGTEATPSAGANHYKFTGKERDYASGNDYFGARYYSSNMGRFMSPDPSQLYFADPNNPQSFNLYNYVRNNPLMYIDPSGLALQMNCHSDGDTSTTSTDANGNTTVTVRGDTQHCTMWDDGVGAYRGFVPPQKQQRYIPPPRNFAQNEPKQQKTFQQCEAEALRKNAVALSLDAVGVGAAFIPGGGLAVTGVQMGVGVASTINSSVHQDMAGSLTGIGGFQMSALAPAATYAAEGAGEVGLTTFAKAIPFVGGVVSAYSTIHDATDTYRDYQSCMAGH